MTKKRTIYVVSERSFEYNDEIYHLPGDGSGNASGKPQLAFPDKEKASKTRDSKNLKWFKELVTSGDRYSNSINSYTYESIDSIFNTDVLDELKVIYDEESLIIPENFSDENFIRLMNNMSEIPLPWIVSEVTYEE